MHAWMDAILNMGFSLNYDPFVGMVSETLLGGVGGGGGGRGGGLFIADA